MKIISIILLTVVLLNPIYATGANDTEVGLKVGQWIKYRPSINVDGDGNFEETVRPFMSSFRDNFMKEYGMNIEDVEWIKRTVTDISGTVITFDREIKSNNGSIKKLESAKLDLAEFNPRESHAMPINLEFGSKFHDEGFGDIIFYKTGEDILFSGIKINEFVSKNIFSQTIRSGVVENTIEYEVTGRFVFDKKTGILLLSYRDLMFTNTNTHDRGWVTSEVYGIEYSDDVKQDRKNALNDREEILERLSDHFVETPNSRFLIKNEFVSITDPKLTTYDIIRVKDGSELGILKLYGDDKISSIIASTTYSFDKRTSGDASDVLQGILIQLTDHDVSPNHEMMLIQNTDKGEYTFSKTFDDVQVTQSWFETNSAFGIGIFSLEINYLDESTRDSDKSTLLTTQDTESTNQQSTTNTDSEDGGCLIATAAFGTELAPQVQMLREVRDNVLFSTGAGTTFLAGFNNVYYAFSPVVADLERQSPLFKEIVKTTITPMLSTLSILNYVDINSEQEMLGYGIGVILLNIGMYFVAPALVIVKLREKFRKI